MSVFSLKKAERILKRAEFQRLSRQGRRIHRDHFIVIYCPNSLGELRLGVTVSKKVGHAATRNRIKRLVRERFRLSKAVFDGAYDINIIAKTGAAELSSQEITQTLEGVFREVSKDYKHKAIAVGTH